MKLVLIKYCYQCPHWIWKKWTWECQFKVSDASVSGERIPGEKCPLTDAPDKINNPQKWPKCDSGKAKP